MIRFRDPNTNLFTSASFPRAIITRSGIILTGNERRRVKRAAVKRAVARAAKVEIVPAVEPVEVAETTLPIWARDKELPTSDIITPDAFPLQYDGNFEKFTSPISKMRSRIRRLMYVLVELNETKYRTEDGTFNLIIPLRLGQFTRREVEAMSIEDVIEHAESWEQWGQVISAYGVFMRKD